MKRFRGFTLTELIVTMVVLVTLMCIAVPAFTGINEHIKERRAASNGTQMYMSAMAAVDTAYTMHKAEFEASVSCKTHPKNITYTDGYDENGNPIKVQSACYGRLTDGGISSIQCRNKKIDYVTGFKSFYKDASCGHQRGDTIICKYLLESLDALDKNILNIDEKYRFISTERPAGKNSAGENFYESTVEGYNQKMSKITYTIPGVSGSQTCKQAGVIITYGKVEGRPGEVIYTEYGDSDGYLVICINPAWYNTMKKELIMVQQNPLSEREEKELLGRSTSDPVVIVIKNGLYEAPDMK